MKARHALSVSYQAVYKVLKKWVEKGIVRKDDLRYQISQDWLESQRDFYNNLLSDNHVAQWNTIYDSGSTRILSIQSLKELDNRIQQEVVRIASQKGIKTTYWSTPHCWWLAGYPIEESEYISQYAEAGLECYATITRETALDQEHARFYKNSSGYHVVCYHSTSPNVYQVVGEYILLCKLPSSTLNVLRKHYNQEHSLNDFLKVIQSQVQIELQILRIRKWQNTSRTKYL